MKPISLLLLIFTMVPIPGYTQKASQWRGPDRNGIFPEKNLLKSWPEGGPQLLWVKEKLDRGYASVSVTDQFIYLAGAKSREEFLTVLDHKGNQLWRIRYGKGVRRTYPDTRCTPTVEGDRIYLISGSGEVVCISNSKRKILCYFK